MTGFWEAIDAQLDRIKTERPDTFDGVKVALGRWSPDGNSSFFAGSGGERQLVDVLRVAGWRVIWEEASYFYVAGHPVTGEVLTYIEGDVYRGDQRPQEGAA